MVFSLPGHNHKDYPYVSYYQYGLSILALCVHQKRVHDSVVKKLLYAVEHDQHFYQGTLSVGEWARPCPGQAGTPPAPSPKGRPPPLAPGSPFFGTPS